MIDIFHMAASLQSKKQCLEALAGAFLKVGEQQADGSERDREDTRVLDTVISTSVSCDRKCSYTTNPVKYTASV